jgi:uncharacterized membrane protein YeaQ/YmgE (transglycosylase-associated protein family)
MLLNIALTALFFAILGALAHRIAGGGGSFLHLVFVGFAGYMISDTIRTIFDLDSMGLIKILLLDVICSCVVVKLLVRLKTYLIKRKILEAREHKTDDSSDRAT